MTNDSNLFEALKSGANMQLLTVNPISPAAQFRAGEDEKFRSDGLKKIQENFLAIRNTFESLKKSLEDVKGYGRLELRLIDVDPIITIYHRDDEVLIYGHYLPGGRGDEFAGLRITEQWNHRIFRQFSHHFTTQWERARQEQLIFIDTEKQWRFETHRFREIYQEMDRLIEKSLKEEQSTGP